MAAEGGTAEQKVLELFIKVNEVKRLIGCKGEMLASHFHSLGTGVNRAFFFFPSSFFYYST